MGCWKGQPLTAFCRPSVGIADGMSYDNAEVQKTIDAVFVNETLDVLVHHVCQ